MSKKHKGKKDKSSKPDKEEKKPKKAEVTTTKTDVKPAAKAEVIKAPFQTKYADTDEMVTAIHTLSASRTTNEAHLSFVLWTLEKSNSWKKFRSVEYSTWADFCKEVLKISAIHANAHIKNWQLLDQLGMSAGDLSKYDFSKLKLLCRLGDDVSSKEMREKWLPRALTKGSDARTMAELTEQVDEKLKSARSKKGGGATSYPVKLSSDDRRTLVDNVDRLASTLKTDTGKAILQAVSAFALEHSGPDQGEATSADILAKTKERVEAAVPGTRVIYFGKGIVTYNCYVMKDDDGVAAIIAPSKEIAEAMSGGKAVTEIPVRVSDAASERVFADAQAEAKADGEKKKSKKDKESKKDSKDAPPPPKSVSVFGIEVTTEMLNSVRNAPKSAALKTAAKAALKDAIKAGKIEKGTKFVDVVAGVTAAFKASGVDTDKGKMKKVAWALLTSVNERG